MFSIRNGLKHGDALSPLLFKFALQFVIKRVQVNQDGLKLYGTCRLLAYASDVNMLGGNVPNAKYITDALEDATKDIGLEVNADKPRYMVMSGEQNAGRNDSIKIDNISIERAEAFKYFGTTLTDQNFI
jgi:hypothetical protein